MRLSLFNGGLNTRQASELIKPNEATVCHNVDVQTGQIVSEQGLDTIVITSIIKAFYFLTEAIWMPQADSRDYLEYQGKLYWSDGSIAKKYTLGVTNDLGIAKPLNLPATSLASLVKPPVITTVLNGAGLLSGSYTYVYTYYDAVRGIESLPSPISPALTAVLNQIDIAVTASTIGTVTSIIIYRRGNTLVEYTKVVSLANATATYTDNLIDSALSGTALALLPGTLQYVYTYYNVGDGTESEPSPTSPEIVADNGIVDVTVVASTDTQVTHIRIYRIGNTLTAFTKVVELANVGATFSDSTVDALLTNEILTSEFNGKAPQGLKYLTYNGGIFFGAIGTKLYFTRDIGNPNYWPETNYTDFRVTLTGIGITPAGIIVFSRYEAWIVTGSNAATFIAYPLSGDQGCISHKTIAKLGNAILFMSTDGICTATGSQVQVASKFKLGKQLYDPINAVVYDEEYLCQLSDNSIISLDMRYEPILETYDFNTTWLAIAQDKLYGEFNNELYEMFQGVPVVYNYTTGNLTEGTVSELKAYDDVYLYVVGTHTVSIYINDILIATKVIVGTPKPQHMAIPQAAQLGSSIRFECTGVGTIKEIEYAAEGRENG